jgi:hypothetical protein
MKEKSQLDYRLLLGECEIRESQAKASITEYMDICEDLSRKLEASRHRVEELEDRLKRFLELINLREWTLQGSPEEILEAFRTARSTLEGKHPNAESLAAMQELEDGGGEMFSSVEALMKDLESDD